MSTMHSRTAVSPLRDLPHYLAVFQTYLGRRMYFVFALALAAALAEGVGILMLLPMLQSLDGSTAAQAGHAATPALEGVSGHIHQFLEMLGLAESIPAVLLIITGAFIIKGLLVFGSNGYTAYLRGQLLREIKGRLFDNYSRMTYSYYSSRDTGHFLNVINEQISQMLNTFVALINCGVQAVNTIIYISLAFLIAWRFGLMALVIGVVMMFLFRGLNNHVRRLSRKSASENGHLAKLLIQSLHGFKYLTATGQMGHLRKGIMGSIHRLTGYQIRAGMAGAFSGAVREPIIIAFIMLVVLVQLVFLQQPLAPILISIVLFYRGLNAIMGMQVGWMAVLNQIGSLEIVRDEFSIQKRQQEVDDGRVIPPLSQSITLDKVSFSYDQQLGTVLQDVSLQIPVLTSVALVGESGSGKSTLVDLITLMLKPQQGSILIDGVPGEQVELASWRKQVGYVSQETVVFDDTVANNICLWEGDIEQDEKLYQRVCEAAKQAHIDDFIESLPDGYSSLVGDRGMRLSGGQRQRLFIARELFRRPNLLILDEATSALDSESERAIQQSIDALKGQTTVIIIAHRLSTIRNVDHVYVFDKGHLIEEGAYQELRDKDGSKLSRMIKMQAH